MDDKENEGLKDVLLEFYDSHKRLILTVGTIIGTIGLVYVSGKIFKVVAKTANDFKDMRSALKRKV